MKRTALTTTEILALVGIALFLLVGITVALLIPEPSQHGGSRKNLDRCANNLKMLAIAFHNYHDTYMAFPAPYTVDENGNMMHSWRTAILPFIEQAALYDNIRRDEPWDSPHNSQFHHIDIPEFRCPEADLDDLCCYSVIVGPDTPFTGPNVWNGMATITDGTSNTLLLVERKTPLKCWMDPRGEITQAAAEIGINKTLDGIGSRHGTPPESGANSARCDGSVHFLSETIDPAILRALITARGGEWGGGP